MTMPLVPRPEQDDDHQDMPEEGHVAPETAAASETPQVQPQGNPSGGPLGCCLGITVGLLLSLSVAVISRLYATPLAGLLHGGLSITVRVVMLAVGVIAAIIFGYLGWKIGSRVYKEYELSPRQKARLEKQHARARRGR